VTSNRTAPQLQPRVSGKTDNPVTSPEAADVLTRSLAVSDHVDNRRAAAEGRTYAGDPRHRAGPEACEPLTAWQPGRSVSRLGRATKVLLVRLGEC
jgi:hypothetical protein